MRYGSLQLKNNLVAAPLAVSAGILWMVVMAAQVRVFGLRPMVKLRLLRLALFWHMLDVVWIGIFTFVYLFGVVS